MRIWQDITAKDSLKFYFNKKGEKIFVNPDKTPEFTSHTAGIGVKVNY